MKLKRSSCWQEGTESQYENRVVRQVDLFMVINPTLGYSHTVSSEAKAIAVMANSRLISIGVELLQYWEEILIWVWISFSCQ